MNPGCYTALITPFRDNVVDFDGLLQLVEFQVQNGIDGILAVGTTGESPTLNWEEHNSVIEAVAKAVSGRCACIAGTGSNNTKETLAASQHAADLGVDAVLLVDPYYNGPSSLEIRREYIEPVASAYPSLDIIPYVIPGRTGCQLLPEDIAVLSELHPNVRTVKEATGNLDNMKRTRECCGPDFLILSGDDGLTFEMMTDPSIGGGGVISVATNIAPAAVLRMVHSLLEGDIKAAEEILSDISPLFDLVTVKTVEQTPYGDVTVRARNPLAIKTVMEILGMPSGMCRRPLGKMTRKGIEKVIKIIRDVHRKNPKILGPVEDFFGVEIDARINDPAIISGLFYED